MYDSVVSSLAQPMEPVRTGVSPRLTPLKGIRAVLFDVYGTLLISGSGDIGIAAANSKEESFVLALRAASQSFQGEAKQGLDDFHSAIAAEHDAMRKSGKKFPEVRIEEIWQRVTSKWHQNGLADEPASAERVRRLAIEYEMRVNPVWPMPGLVATLDSLRAAGVNLGIVSNAQSFTQELFEPLTERTLSSLGFVEELCFWSYEYREAKPGTRLYEEARDVLAACGIEAEETLYVGNDMRNDIWPASQVGFQTALFAGDERSLRMREDDADVAGVEPTVVVTELGQVLDVLNIARPEEIS